MKYVKLPIVVDADRWWTNGDHPDDGLPPAGKILAGELSEGRVVRYFNRPDVPADQRCRHCSRVMGDHGWIDTLEGGHIVCPGDWIITGVRGERYRCKPEVFAQTYQALDDPAAWPGQPVRWWRRLACWVAGNCRWRPVRRPDPHPSLMEPWYLRCTRCGREQLVPSTPQPNRS
ncbi:hypothetical protein ACFFMN_23705 [Planobispora siamensis]|uniref:Uncharacterized protein n=1 Tax=Planobispora siamensis TaxID=936338 RepID=A0A8J3SN48_9ACTN|nr:hypothetical protein [Planobispora siamensis]GIH95364.1 hypothetical protein Psi01_59940 [Planobispora siamensis]